MGTKEVKELLAFPARHLKEGEAAAVAQVVSPPLRQQEVVVHARQALPRHQVEIPAHGSWTLLTKLMTTLHCELQCHCVYVRGMPRG